MKISAWPGKAPPPPKKKQQQQKTTKQQQQQQQKQKQNLIANCQQFNFGMECFFHPFGLWSVSM